MPPAIRRDLVAPERREALRRVLHATAAKRPHVGYAQGMTPGPGRGQVTSLSQTRKRVIWRRLSLSPAGGISLLQCC